MIADYEAWCGAQGFECLSQAEIAGQLSNLFREQGFQGRMVANEPHIIGIAIKA